MREEKIAKLLRAPIKKVTLERGLVDWLKDALKESDRSTTELQEKRQGSLKGKYELINTRLSKLVDAKLDGEITDEIFKTKENEYKGQLIDIKAQMNNIEAVNPNFYDDACRTFELSNRLYSQYVRGNYEEKAKLARLVASNFSLVDATLYPTYRRPFSLFAKRASRSNWLPLYDAFRNHDINFEIDLNVIKLLYEEANLALA